MTIDHVGYMLFPDIEILRWIGRIAMPLFCFLIAFGATKTRDITKYFLRLFAFAIVVQIPFNIFEYGTVFAFYNWNIFFTLSVGVLCIMLIKKFIPVVAVMYVVCVLVVASILPMDYGMAGVLLIVLFYLALSHSLLALKITATLSVIIFNILLIYLGSATFQWFSLLAVPFIILFSPQKLKISKIEKWSFYIYYPLHFIIIYLIGLAF